MLTIIGEAAKMVSLELRAEHPEIPGGRLRGCGIGSSTIILAWITKRCS